MDPFALIGVPRKLDLEEAEIERLLLEASQIHHPDNGGDQDLFLKIRSAGEILNSPAKRVRAAIECEGLTVTRPYEPDLLPVDAFWA